MKSRLSKSSSSHHYVQSTMNRIQRIRNKPKKLRKYLPPPQQKFRPPPTPIKIKTREYEIPKNLNKSGSMLTDTIEKSNPSGKA